MDKQSKKIMIMTLVIAMISFLTIAIPFGVLNNKNKLSASVSYSYFNDKYVYFDLEAFTNSLPSSTEEYDYMKVAFALQGLINRNKPILFYKYKSNGFPYLDTNIDLVWESVLADNGNILDGKTKITYTSFDEVIQLAKDLGVVNGAVLWDPDVPATSNVASTIAGVENLVPIRKDITNFSCYTDLIVNRGLFVVQKDLTGKFTGTGYLPDENLNSRSSGTASSGSTKNDAYLWAKKYYLNTNKTNSSLMGYARDAWIAPCSTKACFVDSWVPQNMTPGEERQVFVTILNNTTGEWSAANNYRIAAANEGNNAFKVVDALYGYEQGNDPANIRLYLDPNNNISPGERYRVTFTIKAPNTAGTYHLNLGAVHDGHRWLGGTIDLTINVGSSSTGNVKTEHYGTYPQGIFNSGLNSSDYLIQNKAFFFDLSPDASIAPIDDRNQPVGKDVQTWRKLLAQQKANNNDQLFTVIGFVPWFMKYTNFEHMDPNSQMEPVIAEWTEIDLNSEYGGITDADAQAPVGLTNASLYKHQTLNSFTQKNDKEAIMSDKVVKEVYDSNTKYYVIYMGDYDCGAWTSGVMPSKFLLQWGYTDRYPLAWQVNPDLSTRIPQAFNWMYDQQQRNDYFVAGDNGSGYLNPMTLDSTGLTNWKNHNIEKLNQFDLDITGFVIAGNSGLLSDPVKNAYAAISPVLVGYQANQTSNNTTVGTTPFISARNADTARVNPSVSLGQDIYNQVNASSNNFVIVRTVQFTRNQAYTAIDEVNSLAAANNKKFKLVDPYTFAQLYTDHPTKYKGCYTNGTDYQWINATTIPSGYSYVNTVSSSTDCHKTKIKIAKPNIVKTSYVYNTNTRRPSIEGLDTSVMAFEGETSATDIGNYTATIRIKDKESYEWEDGTQTDIVINWEITKRILTKPTIEGENTFSYNAKTQGITITGYYENYMEKTGDESAVITGNYQVKIALKDRNNCEWEDGTTKSVYLYWYIKKAKLTKPTFEGSNTFTYNGSSQFVTLNDYDSKYMTRTGSISRTNAGTYPITIALNDKDNYQWEDKTQDDVALTWYILKAQLPKPTITGDNIFTYDGSYHGLVFNDYNEELITIEGNNQIESGSYVTTVSIATQKNYEWEDGTNEGIIFTWSIAKAQLIKPTFNGESTFTYDGTQKTVSFNNYNTGTMTRTGNVTRTNAGTYPVTFAIIDSDNYEWKDGTTANVVLNWNINKLQVTKPTISGSTEFTYNGNYQGLEFNNLDNTKVDVTGNNQVNVGSYTTTISLKDSTNYEWTDGTSAAQIHAWSITKANLDAAVTMADYYENATPSTPVVTGNSGSGAVTYTYAVKGQDNYSSNAPTTKGEYTVKAVIAATNNYNGQIVTSNFNVLEAESEIIVLPEGSIITDVGLYGELIDSYNAEKGTNYNYTHLFTEEELASLKTLVISYDNYHGVEVLDLSNLTYLTGLENLTIDFWQDCEIDSLNLSANTELKKLIIKNVIETDTVDLSKNTKLKNLTVNNSTINILNISKSTLNNINLDKPENIGYLMLDKGKDVSYLLNSSSSQDETIKNNSFGITCDKYNIDIGETTNCMVKGKTNTQMYGLVFKLLKNNNNITISDEQVIIDLDGDLQYQLDGPVPVGDFDIISFKVTGVSGGSTKLYLDDYAQNKPKGYVDNVDNNFIEVEDEISKMIYVNKYAVTNSVGTVLTEGNLQTNYILKIVDNYGIYNSAFNIAVLGDVKADGIIDLRDVAKAYDGLANGNYTGYTNTEKYALDMNCDGRKSVLDIIKIYDAME